MATPPRIIPTIFTAPGLYGDFEFMIQDPCYQDSLFIFNDNVLDHETSRKGAGNAVIGGYNSKGKHSEYPRSAGIPTGYSRRSGGYKSLTPSAQREIDKAVEEIKELQSIHNYGRIFFSAEASISGNRPQLSTSIFQIGDDVRAYITRQIYSLGEET